MIVATAGHIDHGKTLLVKTLTGVDTDRLPEEKTRGISIDLGFAYWPLGDGALIGFVDVPGHERFIRNMLAGVCGIDFALLVVAADDGVMPQTVEHVQILHLLGIRQGIAVITKTDRVGPDQVAKVAAAVQALLADTTLAGIPLLPASAITGSGIDALRQALVVAAGGMRVRLREGQHFRFAIDRAFTVVGSGTVVTGTVFNGQVKPDDRLVVSPIGTAVRVRGIQIRGIASACAQAGQRCAINLADIDVGAVARGDWLLHEALHAPSRRLEVNFTLLAHEQKPLAHWTPVHLHLATADVSARVAILRAATIAPGASKRLQLVLDKPVAAINGDRFILRDQSAARTLGGGVVLDPFAPATQRATPARLAVLAALEQTSASAAFAGLLKIPEQTVDVARFEKVFNVTAERGTSLYQFADAELLGRERRVAMARTGAAALRERIVMRLAAFHRGQAQAPGMKLELLRSELASYLTPDAFSSLLHELINGRRLEMTGSLLKLPGHDSTANAQDEKIWQAVLPAILRAGYVPPQTAALAASLGLKEQVLKDFLHRKSKTGEVMRVTEYRFYPKATLARLAANAAALAHASPGEMFTVAQYRDANAIGRTLTIQILEFFDTLGITQRVGDRRKMRRDFVPILGPAEPVSAPAVRADGASRRSGPDPSGPEAEALGHHDR
ncbi:MAG TPA: selenocysteine-specific translation elongation factor [Rhodocyclaceae bacterium]|nr:selenocysteine-specific translation elongation factor [Rhodocyclaceae bacterium]